VSPLAVIARAALFSKIGVFPPYQAVFVLDKEFSDLVEPTADASRSDLDPDWNEFRQIGHRMIDDMASFLASVRERPVWTPTPNDVRERLQSPVPLEPEGSESAYRDFQEIVQAYPLGNIHPRFWGWVIGTGLPFGALADFLASCVNPNVFGGDQVPAMVEAQVIEWFKELLGYPKSATGILVSGGSMANLVGLAVGRNARCNFDVNKEGLHARQRLTVYGSQETHSSADKSVQLLGLGGDCYRKIPVDADYRIDLVQLEASIDADIAAGNRPVIVIANVGTVNTGAFDDIEKMADICEPRGIWLHADGAFGALTKLSQKLAHLSKGLVRADSIAFDLHKWLHMPHEAGCILIRHPDLQAETFRTAGSYLSHAQSGFATGGTWLSEQGLQLSRGFKALKVWMTFKQAGLRPFVEAMERNVEQGQYLAAAIRAEQNLELMAPVPLNIVCFRFTDPSLDVEELNALNQGILAELQESGLALPS